MNPSHPGVSVFRALVPFCLALLLMAVVSPASQEFQYRERTGAESLTFLWRTEQGHDGITVTVTQDQKNEFYSSVCAQDGSTLSWHHIRRPDIDVRAERIGNRIQFSGRFGGREIKRSETIDQRPWYQPLSYSLQRLVARGQQAATFWTIRPDTLDILAMQAKQSECETLGTGKQAFTARDPSGRPSFRDLACRILVPSKRYAFCPVPGNPWPSRYGGNSNPSDRSLISSEKTAQWFMARLPRNCRVQASQE